MGKGIKKKMQHPKTIILETNDISIGDIVIAKLNPTVKLMVVSFEIDKTDTNGIVEAYRIRASKGDGDMIYFYPIELEKLEITV